MKGDSFHPEGFEAVIAEVLARFASSSGPEIDNQIAMSLEEIARFVGTDYAFVVQVSSDFTTWSGTHEWCAPGVSSLLASHRNVPMGTLDWIERAILAGEVTVF